MRQQGIEVGDPAAVAGCPGHVQVPGPGREHVRDRRGQHLSRHQPDPEFRPAKPSPASIHGTPGSSLCTAPIVSARASPLPIAVGRESWSPCRLPSFASYAALDDELAARPGQTLHDLVRFGDLLEGEDPRWAGEVVAGLDLADDALHGIADSGNASVPTSKLPKKLNCTPLGMSRIGRNWSTGPRPPRNPAWQRRPFTRTACSESRSTLLPTRSSARSGQGGAAALDQLNAVLSHGHLRLSIGPAMNPRQTLEVDDPAWRPAVMAAAIFLSCWHRRQTGSAAARILDACCGSSIPPATGPAAGAPWKCAETALKPPALRPRQDASRSLTGRGVFSPRLWSSPVWAFTTTFVRSSSGIQRT